MFLHNSTALHRILRAPEGDGGGAAPVDGAPTPDATADAGQDTSADGAANGGAADDGATDDAASPGDGDAGAKDGAADDGDGTSGDAPAAEAAPFEGLVPPEGFASLDAEALKAATPILRGLGVDTPERAQEVVNEFAPVIQGLVERAVLANAESAKTAQADLAKAWADETRADPEIGGGNYDKTVANNALVLDTFFSPEFREYLDVTGLGNNPAMVKGLAKIHAQIEQGSIHLGGAAPAKKEMHQKLYDPAFDGPQTPAT